MDQVIKKNSLVFVIVLSATLLVFSYYAFVNKQQQFAVILMFLLGSIIPRVHDLIASQNDEDFRVTPIEYINIDNSRLAYMFSQLNEEGHNSRLSDAPVIDSEPGVPDNDWRPSRFVGSDNALALAQLRLSLEREIRRISLEHKQVPTPSLLRTIRSLVQSEILSKDIDYVIRNVIRVCNSAVHGADIDDSTTETIVENGETMLEFLRRIRLEQSSPA